MYEYCLLRFSGGKRAVRSSGVRLVRSSISRGAEVGGGAGAGEEAAKHGLEEGVEDDLGPAGL